MEIVRLKENFKTGKYILTLVLILLFHNSIYGQVISGMVTFRNFDDLEEPASGATVMIKGTNKGIVTDINGKYQIEIDSTHNTLQFNYMGYETQKINLGKDTIINIILEKEPIELLTFELTAYMQPGKIELTGVTKKQRHKFFRKRGKEVVQENRIVQKSREPKILKIEKKWDWGSGNSSISDWINHIYENIDYPDSTIFNGIIGKVYVKFAIDSKGCLKDLEIIRGLDDHITQNIISTFKSMPEFKWEGWSEWSIHPTKYYPVICILPLRYRIIECKNET
jgi:hypothetical protein